MLLGELRSVVISEGASLPSNAALIPSLVTALVLGELGVVSMLLRWAMIFQ